MNHHYFMEKAIEDRKNANCFGNRVGAVIVKDNTIVSSGYNSTFDGQTECLKGGCPRCLDRDSYPDGKGYGFCFCIHAEQKAILNCAKYGIKIDGGKIYSTLRPCIGCTKEIIQVGIKEIYYIADWVYSDPQLQKIYDELQNNFCSVKQLNIEDKDAIWALARLRKRNYTIDYSDELGHY